jgi:small-conductance mechanosensitive channel/CRP-like cAMP-binding protein
VSALLSSLPAQVVTGLVLIGLAGAVRAFTNNRVVRGRVRLTMLLGALFVGINALLAASDIVRPESRPLVISISQLLFAYALIHFVVLVLVNPLRRDRVPDYFPTIVQDVLVFVLFAMVATLVMEEKFLTTSAVGAVVAGLALQDTLGNLVSGLAIQVEKPFHVGHWISSGSWEGEVVEITWRATKLRTRHGNQVIVPNGELAKAAIINYSEPASPTRIEVEVGTAYNNPPNLVKAVMLGVLDREPLVLKSPAPAVHVISFDASSILHRARFWIQHFPMDEVIADRVRTGIYYAFKREGIDIPYPTAVEYGADLATPGPDPVAITTAEDLLAGTDLFGLLSVEDRQALAAASPLRMFGDGEAIVRQGDAGYSAFVVCSGRVRVSLDPGDVELAVLDRGAYFGEMSLLTGDPRTAWVRALGDCTVVEITSDAFRAFVLNQPALVEPIGAVIAERRAGIARARATVANVPPPESASSLVARVRRFFHL